MIDTNETQNSDAVWEQASAAHEFFTEASEDGATSEADLLAAAVATTTNTEDPNTETPAAGTNVPEVTTEVEAEETEQHEFTFGEEEEEEEEDNSSTEDNKGDEKPRGSNSKSKISSMAQLEFLKEKNLVEYELDESETMTDALAEEILEDSWNEQFDAHMEEVIGDMPDNLKNLIKVHKEGGDVDGLLAKYSAPARAGITTDMDISVEANQIKVLENAGHEAEYIDFLKESGKLEAKASTEFDAYVDKAEVAGAEAAKSIAQRNKVAKQEARAFKVELTNHISESEGVNGMPFTKKDSKLASFISDKTVETESGNYVTPLFKGINDALKDKDKTILLAKLIESDFDFSAITRAAETDSTRKTRQQIQNTKEKKEGKTGSSRTRKTSKKRNLWENL